MNGRWGTARPPIWHLALFAVALLLVGFLAVRQIRRTTTTAVWMARLPLSAGAPVRGEELERKRIDKDEVSPTMLLEREQIEGRTLQRPKQQGQPFLAQDFVKPPETIWLSEVLPEGRIVSSVRVGSVTFPVKNLKRGDRLDVIAINRKGDSRVVGRDAWVLGWINGVAETAPVPATNPLQLSLLPPAQRQQKQPGQIVAFILGMHPEDVIPVARADAIGDTLSFALHARQEQREGQILELPSSTESSEVEVISGTKKERVDLTP